MHSRTLFACLVAVLSAGSMLAPSEAAARSAGLGMGRPAAFPGGFVRLPPRPFVRPLPAAPRPFLQFRPAPRPLVRGPFVDPRHPIAGPRAPRHHPRRHDHRPYEIAFPVAGVTVYSGWPGYSNDDEETPVRRSYVVPTEYSSTIQTSVPPGGDAGPLRHVCRTQTETVPSERGGKTEITITRCYRTE
jgi:hypothetical protein